MTALLSSMYNITSCLFQGVLPIYKYPKVIQGPNINERGPNDGNFKPEKYFKCPVLDHKVEKIDVSFKWRDQVIFWYPLDQAFKISVFFRGEGSKICQICRRIVA